MILFTVGFLLSFTLANAINNTQLENARFDVTHAFAPRVLAELRQADMSAPLEGDRLTAVHEQVQAGILGGDIIRVKIWNRDGTAIYSSDGPVAGASGLSRFGAPWSDHHGGGEGSESDEGGGSLLAQVLAGKMISELERTTAFDQYEDAAPPETLAALEIYAPISFGEGEPAAGVLEIYEDYGRWAAQAATVQRHATLGLAGGLAVAYVVLMSFVQRGVLVIHHQNDALAAQAENLERAYGELSDSEDRFRSLVLNASDVIVTVDEGRMIRYASPSVARQWGLASDELVGRPLLDIVDAETADELERALAEISGDRAAHATVEFAVLTTSKETKEVQATVTNLLHRPSVGGIVLNCRDVTERSRLERMLTHHAYHDGLTNLPNRMFFMRELQEVIDGLAEGRLVAVYLMDVDRFKAINDQLGHPAGDALLKEIAGRLAAALPNATVARLGGDEFAALMTVASEAEAIAAARAIVGQFESPFRYEGTRTPISGSIGVAVAASDERRSVSDLVRAADVALYRVKSEGGAAFVVADAALEAAWMQRRLLERDVLTATDNGELRLLYQPIIALDSQDIIGVEALVRWMHPEHGLILPDQFIPIAEACDAITQIDRWVRAEAAAQLDRWRRAGVPLHRDFRMRLNVSAVELADPGFIDAVQATLRQFDAPPRMIEFEVTESTLVRDVQAAAGRLGRLKDAGFNVAIDDFGTGYSSLAYLSTLPVNTLKIDRAFTMGIVESETARAVVQSVITMARSLGQTVVAEGIESEAQLRLLAEFGCHLGQGYYLSRPVDARAVERMIDRQRAARRSAGPIDPSAGSANRAA